MKDLIVSIICFCFSIILCLFTFIVVLPSIVSKVITVKVKDVLLIDNGLIYYDYNKLYDYNFYKYIDYKNLPFRFKFNKSYNKLCNYYINDNETSVIEISKLDLSNYEE